MPRSMLKTTAGARASAVRGSAGGTPPGSGRAAGRSRRRPEGCDGATNEGVDTPQLRRPG